MSSSTLQFGTGVLYFLIVCIAKILAVDSNANDDTHEYNIVLFYSSTDLQSRDIVKELTPKAEKLVNSINFMEINCDLDLENMCHKLNITEYPTIYIYQKGRFVEEYGGPKNPEALIKYIMKKVANKQRRPKRTPSAKQNYEGNFYLEKLDADKVIMDVKEDLGRFAMSILKDRDTLNGIDQAAPALDPYVNTLIDKRYSPYSGLSSFEDPIKVAVKENFNQIVTNNDKDTMIVFYAPWCPHCKAFEPVYEQLADKLESENIAVVKMDATANEVPYPYDVVGYPTIYWANKNSKLYPVRYDGTRDVNSLLSFVAKHSTNELQNYDRYGNTRYGRF